MRFAADPVLVAVALGLLSELALEESESELSSDNEDLLGAPAHRPAEHADPAPAVAA